MADDIILVPAPSIVQSEYYIITLLKGLGAEPVDSVEKHV